MLIMNFLDNDRKLNCVFKTVQNRMSDEMCHMKLSSKFFINVNKSLLQISIIFHKDLAILRNKHMGFESNFQNPSKTSYLLMSINFFSK